MPGTLAAASAAARQFWPATRRWRSPPIAAAAVTACSVAAFSAALSCSETIRIAMSDHPRLVAELVDELGHGCDLASALALRRLLDFERHESRRDIDAELLRRQRLDRLLLRLHDIGQRGVARLVKAEIGRHHGRQLELDGLEPAIDLARHEKAVALALHLGGEGSLRPAEERRQHLPGLVAVIVDRLLAEDAELGLLLLDDGF